MDLSSLIKQLDLIETEQEKFELLVELSSDLDNDASLLEDTKARVSGCASNTYLRLNQQVDVQAYSDSILVRGLLVIVVTVWAEPELSQAQKLDRLSELGQKYHLDRASVSNRVNAWSRMIDHLSEHLSDD